MSVVINTVVTNTVGIFRATSALMATLHHPLILVTLPTAAHLTVLTYVAILAQHVSENW